MISKMSFLVHFTEHNIIMLVTFVVEKNPAVNRRDL